MPKKKTTEGVVTRALGLSLYRTMLTIRLTEEQLLRAHQRGLIHGACHTYIGEEAVAAGVCAHLRPEDPIFSTHRGHGHALAKGVDPHALIAELLGRATGCSSGRGGSMHLFAPEIGLMGTTGIVGPCILQAAGAGYSAKLLQDGRVAAAFFGDGASNNGAFHEGLNMAAIWKLPVLFVCENNQFATEIPLRYSGGNPEIAQRAAAYNIPGVAVDGNDVLAVSAVAAEAVRRARAGEGPTLIECKTYRTRPHAEGMGDYTYRTREEVDAWRAKCPIQALRKRLIEGKVAKEAELADIEKEVGDIAASALKQAEADPWPGPETAALHVRDENPPPPAPELPAGARAVNYIKATLEALDAEMARQPGIFVMGEGIGVRGGNFATTAGLYQKYGAVRLCDTPICERGFVGLACGAAMAGARPIIDFMFADFVLDGVGEIINQIAKMRYMSDGRLNMPVILRGCIGIGHSAATHHSGNYGSMFAHFPGLKVAMPSNAYDAKGLFMRALRGNDPVLFLEHRELIGFKCPVPEADYEIEFGKAAVVREGRDVTVVALAMMIHHAKKVCETLAAEGIEVELIDPRTIAPLDTATILASVRKTGRLLVVDEDFAPYSVASEIAAAAAAEGFDDLDAPVRRLHGAFAPVPYSPPLEKQLLPGPDEIAQAVRELLAE
jgi:2-oxoisovalerate dehydrogenase E1 component